MVVVKYIKKIGRLSEDNLLFVFALVVGGLAGLGTFGFGWLMQRCSDFAFGNAVAENMLFGRWYFLVLPALGGLLVGPLVTYLASEAKGHGVPEVMYAVAKQSGRIRPRVAGVKALASALTIGTGGSAGREGPIVQIGSALGSTVGQMFRLGPDLTRVLVACGAAGGIAATFGTPIAGVLFALEVILRDFAARAFSTVVIASVTASAVSRVLLGEGFFFSAPPYSLHNGKEYLLYGLLGLMAALAGRLFIWFLYWCEEHFDNLGIPAWLKPALGGLLLGVVGLFLPQVFGTGHSAIETALWNHLSLMLMLALVFAKIFATAMSLGSGGSGGVFSPSLFVGAMLGGAMGNVFHNLLPEWVVSPGAYALVGMGAVFAAATRAPITAIIIVFEMTNDYQIILPMMAGVVVATVVSRSLSDETIYTAKLKRRGIDLDRDPGVEILDRVPVSSVMRRDVETVPIHQSLDDFLKNMPSRHHTGFPVIRQDGTLAGLVVSEDIQQAMMLEQELGQVVRVVDFMRTPVLTVQPTDNLKHAMEQMRLSGVDHMPVVDPRKPSLLLGIITNSDILRAFIEQQQETSQAEPAEISNSSSSAPTVPVTTQ